MWPIGDLPPGLHGAVEGEIQDTQLVMGRRRMLVCRISDGTGNLTLRFFNFTAAQKTVWPRAALSAASARHVPESMAWRWPTPSTSCSARSRPARPKRPSPPSTPPQRAAPAHPAQPHGSGLAQLDLTGSRSCCLPASIPSRSIWPPLAAPSPASLGGAGPARERPAPGTAAAGTGRAAGPQPLGLGRCAPRHRPSWPVPSNPLPSWSAAARRPAVHPTGAQSRVVAEIARDLQQSHPMMRLVQGTWAQVKRWSRALAALQTIGNGCQVGLMAPTELLAEQHAINFAKWLEPLGIGVGWLAGKQKARAQKKRWPPSPTAASRWWWAPTPSSRSRWYSSASPWSSSTNSTDSAYTRLALREKGGGGVHPPPAHHDRHPHPRTLAMTAYADLDTSIIDELPPGRTPSPRWRCRTVAART